MASPQRFVGIDVAAETVTVSWTEDRKTYAPARTVAQDPEGFAQLLHLFEQSGGTPEATLVVMEATSSYWVMLATFLHEAGYAVALVNPKHVHNFARSLPRRAKTDALDAQLLAHFAAERQPDPWSPPPQIYHELRQRLVTREEVLTMRQQARNHLHALKRWPAVSSVREQWETLIADLDARIKQLDKEIAAVLQDSAWAESAALLLTIPGIGIQTAAWLLVVTMNFTTCERGGDLASHAGLTPLPHESGSSVKQPARIGKGGHKRLRRGIYLAAVCSLRYNPAIRVFGDRLRTAGKHGKVIVCAAARKLIMIAWAVVTKRQPFDADYHLRGIATT
jgi:transposase